MRFYRSFISGVSAFVADDCPTLAAALAYYTVFSLPPLCFLLITTLTVSLSMFSSDISAEERAKRIVVRHAATILGNQTIQEEVGAILTANEQESRTWWKSLLGIGAVLVGASGVLSALQNSLNRVWCVAPRKRSHQALRFVRKRIISLAMVLGFGFILIVSFVVNAIIEVTLRRIGDFVGLSWGWANLANFIVALVVIAIMLAAIYRYMPDARIAWSDVLLAAVLASLLFAVGRAVLQLYFQYANPAAQLGSAAASLAAVLIWVYYTSMIVLLGAEFSKAWALEKGQKIVPEPGAARTAPSPPKPVEE
jgi:membrane protein